MARNFIASNIKGVKYRQHETRKHGKQKDKYFIIRYALNGKTKTEAVGWASEGWTLKEAKKIRNQITKNIRLGLHPQSLKEIREENERKYKEIKEQENQ